MIRHSHRARLGFSLLELSVVLGIIALIAGVGMTMASGALKAADRISTQERLNTIKLALDSYGKTYGFLPCPAPRADTPTTATFGIGGSCSGTGVSYGAVPVRTLGLPDSYAGDAWGNKLTYAVSQALTANSTNYSQASAAITVRYGTIAAPYNVTTVRKSLPTTIPPTGAETYGAAGNNSGKLEITFNSASAVSTAMANLTTGTNGTLVNVKSTSHNGSTTITSTTGSTTVLTDYPYSAADTNVVLEWQEPVNATSGSPNAAYVVVSHGPDGRGAFPMSGTSIPGKKLCNTSASANTSPPPCTSSATMTCIDIENCNDDAIFFDTAYNDGATAAQYFDDYVVWGSNAVLRAPANPSPYPTCPTTTPPTCEAWCAKCTLNFPGAGSIAPPASITAGATLCKKIITTDSTKCEAACFWSGTTGSGYQKCP